MIKHSTANFYIDNQGIVRIKVDKHAILGIEEAYEYTNIIEKICDGKKRTFLIDTRGTYSTASSEHRRFMGSNSRALKWRKADAVLVDSLPLRLLAKFYMLFDARKHPVKIFTDEKDALKWLALFNMENV